jgi:hypothetical protein
MNFKAVCVTLLMVSACTGQGVDMSTVPVEPSVPEIIEADWLVHTNGTWVTSAGALIIGTLDIDVESRCVTVATERGNALVVFIDGATLDITDPDEPVLRRYLGDTYRDGQHVEWGGGYMGHLLDSDDPAYSDITIPETCAYDGIWMMAKGV